jgi:hypothetical protein
MSTVLGTSPQRKTAAEANVIGSRLRFLFVTSGFVFGVTASLSSAQTQTTPIQIESREVVLPVEVMEERKDPKGLLIAPDGTMQHVYISHSSEIAGLSSKSFHIFEDGVEQEIRHFSVESLHLWEASDNFGEHDEYSCTPKGIWGGSDRKKIEVDESLRVHTYLITYVPPSSPEGSCHRVALKVDHRHATIFAPSQYCNTKDPLSDPLNGSDLGNRLLDNSVPTLSNALPLSVQVTPFAGPSVDSRRINISAQIPASSLRRNWNGIHLNTSIAILGLVYDKNNALAYRFSDVACVPSESDVEYNGPFPPNEKNVPAPISASRQGWEYLLIPTTYQTQVELGPGEYRLELLLTDGQKFGRATASIAADESSKDGLALSGIALCKRYRQVPAHPRGPTQAPQYVSLAFNGHEFTPAGDTQFKTGEQLMTYVEIYGSGLQSVGVPKISLEMKITDEKTNELKIGTGVRPVDSPMRADHSAIPVVWEMEVAKLPAGSYRLEAQATDSAGHKTPWRAASFEVSDSNATPQASSPD